MLERTMIGLATRWAALAFAASLVITGCGKSEGGDEGGEAGRGDPTDPSGGTGGSTTLGGAISLNQNEVTKVDLLFMIDNSISMADKQRILADAVPVLFQRVVDPICVDGEGNPVGGTNMSGCAPNVPEFSPVYDIHIGIITSSLGNHGGDVCVTDPTEIPPRTLNDSAQLIASVRTGVYSYAGLGPHGFLVWDPRVGDSRPIPETHPNLTAREQSAQVFVQDFVTQIQATGERGCGYESSLEAWYRFLVDPEPINEVTVDPSGQVTVRGFINPVVLQQRAAFLRPDSLLAIVMLTDENDCSIDDEDGHQGWIVGRESPMPRGSDACSHPEDPSVYRCCVPCVLLDSPGFQPPAGCSYGGDVSCAMGPSLTPIEDSMNLRCYGQVRRFGLSLLYPWERYSDALSAPRITLRNPDASGRTEVTNPIYTPGNDGTPARNPSQVFLAGIVGVPWQDIATGQSLTGRGLTFLSAEEMTSPPIGTPGGNRWDVILGDPDSGRLPTDPFMHETIDPRSGANPLTGDAIMPPAPGNTGNAINAHEQNVVNRDDLQYACTFELDQAVPCDGTNQEGCACNDDERAYNRPICQYPDTGDGTQTHAKAYPGVRHLQVLKALGDNAIVASICPKNPMPLDGNPSTDPDYGYNPAVGAIVSRMKNAFGPSCLPRPLSVDEDGQIPCVVVEAGLTGLCPCESSAGRREPRSSLAGEINDALIARGLCGGGVGRACSDYCVCEIEQLAGPELETCQNELVDPGTVHGFCYVEPDAGHGSSGIVRSCPSTQKQTIRFLGDDLPAPNTATFLVCAP